MASNGDSRSRRFHSIEGALKRALGWATADRKFEAEGQAEERLEAPPSDAQAEQEKKQVKRDYGETLDS